MTSTKSHRRDVHKRLQPHAKPQADKNSVNPEWRRGRRASVNRLLVALFGIPAAFVVWGLLLAMIGGEPGANHSADWRPGIIGIPSGLAYLAVVGWWLDHRIAWHGGTSAVLVHTVVAGVLSSPWLFLASDGEGNASFLVNMLAIGTTTLLAATVRGSFPAPSGGSATDIPEAERVDANWHRRPLTTFLRWLVGLIVTGIGFGLTFALWQSINDRYEGGYIFDPVLVYAIGAGVYVLLVPWWVDHFAARLGRWRAFLLHMVIVAVAAAPFAAEGSHDEGAILYGCILATAAAALLFAGMVPESFARGRTP